MDTPGIIRSATIGTPLGKHREPDNSYIHETAQSIAKHLRRGHLVVRESTTYPGTTEEEVRPILESSELRCSRDFWLAFSPEREDPGRTAYSTKSIPKVAGGVDPTSTELAVELYRSAIEQVVPVANARVAESCKLLENVFRPVNIALVNELKTIFARMGVDVWQVIEAAKTKPFGFMAFYPGPGLGGHCIPLDPFYLSWKAAETGAWARFVELSGEINTSMPEYVVARTAEALNEDGKAMKGSRILVLGLSYKANIDDDRESPSYEIIELFRKRGSHVDYCDPFIPITRATRRHDLGMRSVTCDAANFASYDAIVVSTAHDAFKDIELYRGARLIVDTRNMIATLGGRTSHACPRVVKA